MTSADKDEAISKFRNNQTQILVSTTVIEVGVDVPNATVMLIENAGGSVYPNCISTGSRGRGATQSYCLLMSSKTETAQSRLKVLEQSQDGFSSRRWICAFAVLEKCWVVVNLGYRLHPSLVEDQEVLDCAGGSRR